MKVKIWLDAHFSPALCKWIEDSFNVECNALKDLNLRDATDSEIFYAARKSIAIVMTKDKDFCALIDAFGAPPKIIWITCGNTSNRELKMVLSKTFSKALDLLANEDSLVEIGDTI